MAFIFVSPGTHIGNVTLAFLGFEIFQFWEIDRERDSLPSSRSMKACQVDMPQESIKDPRPRPPIL